MRRDWAQPAQRLASGLPHVGKQYELDQLRDGGVQLAWCVVPHAISDRCGNAADQGLLGALQPAIVDRCFGTE